MHNRKYKYILQVFYISLWVLVGLFITYLFDKYNDFGNLTLIGIGIGITVLWAYRIVEGIIVNKLPADPGPHLGSFQFVADANGITIEGTNILTNIKWTGIDSIEQIGNYVLILVGNHLAFSVPKAAIGDGAEIQEFVEELISLKEQNTT